MATGLFQRLLGKLTAASGPPRVLVGAFGKHPAHNEHIEDLAGENRLSDIFNRLYTNGIRAAVDKGVWMQLREDGKLLPFSHSIVWKMPDQIVVGRIWASRDNLHRDRYPLAVVAACPGASLSFALLRILPRMVELEKSCIAATSLNGLRQAVQRCRASMPFVPAGESGELHNSDVEAATAYLGRRPELGPTCQGLINVLYQINREMDAFLALGDSVSTTSRSIGQRVVHLRVPCCGDTQAVSAAAWLRLLGGTLANTSPILLLIPGDDCNWIDILVGKPTEADFFYVRTSAETTPRTTDIPYKIPADFTQNALDTINAAIQTHSDSEPIVPNQSSFVSSPKTAVDAGFKTALTRTKIIAVASAAVLVALIAGALWHHSHSSSSAVAAAEPSPLPIQSDPVLAPPVTTHGTVLTEPAPTPPLIAKPIALLPATPEVKKPPQVSESSTLPTVVAAVEDPKLRSRYLSDLKKQTGPFSQPEFNNAWQKLRDNYLQNNPDATMAATKSAVASISDSITWIQTDHDLSSAPDLSWDSTAAWISPLRNSLKELMSNRRESAILDAYNSRSANQSATTSSIATPHPISALPAVIAFKQLKEDSRQLGSDWLLIDQLLNDGVALDTVVKNLPSGAASIRKLSLSWQTNPVFTDVTVQAALDPVHKKLLAVAHIATLDRTELLRTVADTSQTLPVRLAAWRRLSEPELHWPGDASDFTTELATRDQFISQLADQHAEQSADPQPWETAVNVSVSKEIRALPAQRWVAFASELPSDVSEANARLNLAAAQLEPCGVDAATLTAPLRFNIALAQLHARLAEDAAAPDDSKLRANLQSFCDATSDLNISTDSVSAIDSVLKSTGDLTAPTDGPGAIGLTPAFVNSDTVEFTLNLPESKANNTLRFVRVSSVNEPGRFVATSELSIGILMQTVSEFGDWKQFEQLIPTGAMTDGRLSPCVWKWKDGRMEIADSWLPPHTSGGFFDAGTAVTDYADQLSTPDGDLKTENGNDSAPTQEQPAQFISPHAAVCVAALLGCRLPTVEDWRDALKCDSAATATTGPATQKSPDPILNNLRDKTWKIQQKYIQRMQAKHPVEPISWPDFDIFWPADGKSNAVAGQAKSLNDVNDGVLWFRKTGAQIQAGNTHRFSDLIGNVAEYVTQKAPAADVWPKVSSAPVAHTFVDQNMNWFKVIGGSALSAPEIPVDAPQPIDHGNAIAGFSDVGFRLAFTSTQVPFRQRIASTLNEMRFDPMK